MLNSLQKIASVFFFLFFIFCFTGGFAQSINLKDFEKMNSSKSPEEYLTGKGFVSFGERITARLKIYEFMKASTLEYLSVIFREDTEGAKNFEVIYTLSSEGAYKKFESALTKSEFRYKQQDERYEKFIGTYENITIELEGPTADKHYHVNYLHYQGKELSMPAPADIK